MLHTFERKLFLRHFVAVVVDARDKSKHLERKNYESQTIEFVGIQHSRTSMVCFFAGIAEKSRRTIVIVVTNKIIFSCIPLTRQMLFCISFWVRCADVHICHVTILQIVCYFVFLFFFHLLWLFLFHKI